MNKSVYEGWRDADDITQWPYLRLYEDDRDRRPCADCGKRSNHFIFAGPVFLCMVCVNVRRNDLNRARQAQKREEAAR